MTSDFGAPSRFEDLPTPLNDRILRLVAPTDPETWAHQPLEALGGKSFLGMYNDGGESAVEPYLGRVEDFETGAIHGQSAVVPGAGVPGAGPQGAAAIPDPTQRAPDAVESISPAGLVIRPSFRSRTSAIVAVGSLPLGLFLLTGAFGAHDNLALPQAPIRAGLLLAVVTALSAVSMWVAYMKAEPDGTLARRQPWGTTHRYPRGSIIQVRVSDAYVSVWRRRSPAATADFIRPDGQRAFTIYLDLWSQNEIRDLAQALGYGLADEAAWTAAGAAPDRSRWRPTTAELAAVTVLCTVAALVLALAGARF